MTMKPTVRIGTINEQDQWRRDDCRALSPNQRVDMLLQMQDQYFDKAPRHIKHVVQVRSNGATTL